MHNIKINTLNTPDKFCDMADEIVPPLVEVLRNVNNLREEMHKRYLKLKKSQPGGIYSPIEHPEAPVLWQEYRERYHAIFDPHCTKKFLARRLDCCQSLGNAEFSHLETAAAEVSFLMKSKSKAIVVVYKEQEYQFNYRFILRLEDDIWKIDEAAFQYPNDEKWHINRYM